MSESRARHRSDYWAGFCILVLVVIALALTVLVGYFRANPLGTHRYEVVFQVADGVEGIASGSRIYYGGIDIGQVEKVKYHDSELQVTVAVKQQIRLHPGVKIRREGSLLGGKASLIVTVIGNTNTNALPTGTKINAAPVKDGTTNLIGEENASRLQRIEDSIVKAWEGIEKVESQFGSIGESGQELSELARSAQKDFEGWTPKFENIETNLSTFGTKLDTIEADVVPIQESARQMREAFLELSTNFEGPKWDELVEKVDELSAGFREIAREFEEKVIPQASRIMDEAEASWTQLSATTDKLQELATEGRHTLDIFVANSTLAAKQLSLTKDEVIASLALDLLQRPSEAQKRLIFQEEAMGEWTRMALQIRNLLVAIETIDLTGTTDAEADAILKRLLNTLRDTLDQYKEAQKRLFETSNVSFGVE